MVTDAQELPAVKVAPRLFWWKEVLLIGVFYSLYTGSRNKFGSARLAEGAQPVRAFGNARHLIRIEKALGLFHERAIQHAFLGWHWFLRFWNVFYGSAHFIVTIGVFVCMYRKGRHMFTKWRNCILLTTGLALVGFSLFPVMPPRLLDSNTRYGGAVIEQQQNIAPYGIHDTLEEVGGLWNFDSGAISKLSNQFAAMPSLHCAWSTWCAIVGWHLTRRRWARALLVLHPLITVFCIVVTGNHFWIDGVGGLLTLGLGYLLGKGFDDLNDRRLARKAALAAQ
jgi:hypothetical protein